MIRRYVFRQRTQRKGEHLQVYCNFGDLKKVLIRGQRNQRSFNHRMISNGPNTPTLAKGVTRVRHDRPSTDKFKLESPRLYSQV